MKHLLILAMLALAVNVWGETEVKARGGLIKTNNGCITHTFTNNGVFEVLGNEPLMVDVLITGGQGGWQTNELIISTSPPPVAVVGDITMDTNDCHRITLSDEGIRKLAASGEICKALGRHFWRPGRPGEGEGSSYGGWYADYHPGTTYRTCRVCGKCESKTEGEWK